MLFGVNACDLTAIAYQDRFFAKDPAYRARRERTVLVGLDCERPCAGGFCATVEAGPTVHAGTADLVLARDDDGQWVVFASSEAGEAALAGFTADPVDEEFFTRRAARARAITARFPEDRALRAGIGRLAAGEVPAEFWDGLGLRCFTCSGCTQLCPTCSCSTTIDTPVLETRTVDARTVDAPADGDVAFVRERVWDSCLYEGFQKEASGHHPAARLAQRVERFWFHKFAPEFAAVLGRVGCVGCGRCDITCLGGIGARSVLRRISEAAR